MTPLIMRSVDLLKEVVEMQVKSGKSFDVFKYASQLC